MTKKALPTPAGASASASTPPQNQQPKGPGRWMRGWIWVCTKVSAYRTKYAAKKASKAAVKAQQPANLVKADNSSFYARLFRIFLVVAGMVVIVYSVSLFKSDTPANTQVTQSSLNDLQLRYGELVTEFDKHKAELKEEILTLKKAPPADVKAELKAQNEAFVDLAQKYASLTLELEKTNKKVESVATRQNDIDNSVGSFITEIRKELQASSESRTSLSNQIAELSRKLDQKAAEPKATDQKPIVAPILAPEAPTPGPTVVYGAQPSTSPAPKQQVRQQDHRGLWVGYLYQVNEQSMFFSVQDFMLNHVKWDEVPGVDIYAVEGNKLTIIHPPVTQSGLGRATHIQIVSRYQPICVYKLQPRYSLGSGL